MKLFNINLKAVARIALLFIVALCVVPASAQNYPPTWIFARDYNWFGIVGQQANTYTFNGPGACTYSPSGGSVNGVVNPFFVFSGTQGATTVYYPVFIQDADQTKNEVATPTSTTQGATTCGFAATTSNQHTSFTLNSGTGGLQEAVGAQLQSQPVMTVMLDKSWYQIISQFPSTTTSASIINALTGNSNVQILDTTTSPFTFYQWNGAHYVPLAFTSSPSFTSVTAIAAPTALSTAASTNGLITTATTGGTIPASSTYRLGATCVNSVGGETTLSVDTASAATIATGSGTATNTISVTSPAGCTTANGAVGWRLYMTAASGASLSEILYAPTCTASTGQGVLAGVCAIGSTATITAVITGTATVPATNSAFIFPFGPPASLPVSYPPFTAVGTVASAATGTLGLVNLPAGFLNVLGRTLRICGTAYGTTNGTGGTVTLATKLASVPGVTSVTPFTAVSASIAASVITVNGTFCEYMTTTATGATGTVEMHGTVAYNVAGTAVTSPAQDLIIAASSTVDLTKQDQLDFVIVPTTAGLSAAQLRQLTVEVIQ